jgi:anti-sigma B factor antagonist
VDLICRATDDGVSLSGEIDLASVPVLRDALVRAIAARPGDEVVVDLDGVTVVDDTGLGVLLGAAGRAREAGGDLVLVVNAPRLRHRLESTGLDRAIEIRLRRAPLG